MKITIKTAFVLSFAALAMLQGCAKPDLKAEARKAIQAGFDIEDAAIAKKDIDGIFAYHSPDCVLLDKKDKPAPLSAARSDLTAAFAIPNTTWKRTTVIQELTLNNVKGTEATVTAKRDAEMRLDRPGTGKSGTLHADMIVREYWVKGAQGWRIKREKMIDAKTRMDVNQPGSK